MKEKICYIFGAGEYFTPVTLPADAFVIAADGGLSFCAQSGIEPAVVIGDFDSLGYTAQGNNVIHLPVVKDDTDTGAAVKIGLEKGYRIFVLFGCTGGRLSHTVANLQILNYIAKRGGIGFLVDKEEVATATCKGIDFDKSAGGFLSVFASESGTIVSLSGLKYELEHHQLSCDFPLGVSNEFVAKPAQLRIHQGCAYILFEKENFDLSRLARSFAENLPAQSAAEAIEQEE